MADTPDTVAHDTPADPEAVPAETEVDGTIATPAGVTAGDPGATVRRIPHRRAVAILSVVAVLAVALDIVTKQLATSHLREGEPVRLPGGFVYLLLIRNGGAAWSLGTHFTWLFPAIAALVAAWIVWMAQRLRSLPWAISFGLVLGGALGNLIDRLFRAPGPFVGHVVDFISVFSRTGQDFPIFNAADSCLTIGVVLALILELTGRRRDGLRVRD